MTPADLRARMSALAAAAKALFGDTAERVSFEVRLGVASDETINLMHEAGAYFHVVDGRLISSDHPDYMSICLHVDGCALASYHDIPTVLRPPPDYVPPVVEPELVPPQDDAPPSPPPTAEELAAYEASSPPTMVAAPAPSLPNLRDLAPNDSSIHFGLLELD